MRKCKAFIKFEIQIEIYATRSESELIHLISVERVRVAFRTHTILMCWSISIEIVNSIHVGCCIHYVI